MDIFQRKVARVREEARAANSGEEPITAYALKEWQLKKQLKKRREREEAAEARARAEKVAWEDSVAQLEEQTRQTRKRAGGIVRDMFTENGSELGGPHVLETMRGLLDEI